MPKKDAAARKTMTNEAAPALMVGAVWLYLSLRRILVQVMVLTLATTGVRFR